MLCGPQVVPGITRERTNADQVECGSGVGSAGSSRSTATIRAPGMLVSILTRTTSMAVRLRQARCEPGPDGSALRFSEHNVISHNEHPPVRFAQGHR